MNPPASVLLDLNVRQTSSSAAFNTSYITETGAGGDEPHMTRTVIKDQHFTFKWAFISVKMNPKDFMFFLVSFIF